jgi:SH3 domain protein
MKHFTTFTLLMGFFLIIFNEAALADTMYVSDVLKLTVRDGKGRGEEIIAVLQSGQKVEVLQPEDEWALVRLDNGKEGWVLNRYLTSKMTNNIKLNLLKKKHKTLVAQSASLLEQQAKLKEENKKFKTELEKVQKEAEELKVSYGTLKTESAEFIKLKAKYTKTASQLSEYKEKTELLEKELTKLEFKQTVRGLLTGAGVLLLGFLVGFSARRQRRRTTLR